MATPKVWTFFYGSYLNLEVLKAVDFVPDEWTKAILNGFDIQIQPRANIVKSDKDKVFGIIATATHEELKRLYAHAKDVLGETYLPEAVLVETFDGKSMPALTYISHDMVPKPAENDYVDRIVNPCKSYEFPDWYIKKLEMFRPKRPLNTSR